MKFYTNKAAQEEIESLKSRIEELEADAIQRDEHITSLEASITEKDQTISENAAKITTLEATAAKVPKLEADLEASQKETAEAKESADDKAIEILASVGQEAPLQIDESKPDEITAKSREEFNALTPAARLAFVKAGGKLK